MAPRSSLVAASAAVLVAAALLACSGEPEVDPSVPRGVAGRPQMAAPPIAATPPAAHGASERRGVPARAAPSPAAPIAESETLEEEQPGAPPPRDYAAELRAALGTPRECLPDAVLASAGASLRIPVTIVVTANGRVTRAEVGGSVPEESRRCLRQRAENVVIAPPLTPAPRSISTVLVLEIARSESEPEPEAEWQPPPGRTQAPGITLPARAPSARAPGTLAPDRTLPALGAEDRPPGFVPPSSTLPAQVP